MIHVFIKTIGIAVGLALGRILQVIGVLILARLLGPSELGAYSMALATSGIFSQMIGGSLNGIANVNLAKLKLSSEINCSIGEIISLAAIIGFFATLLLIIMAHTISKYALSNSFDEYTLIAASPLAALGIIEGACQGILAGMMLQRVIALSPIIAGSCGIFIVPLMGSYYGINGAVIGSVATTAISTSILLGIINKRVNNSGGWKMSGVKSIFRLGYLQLIPLSFGNLSLIIFRWIAQALVSNEKDGLASIGFFSAANQVHGAINFVPQALRLSSRSIYASDNSSIGKNYLLFSIGAILIVSPLILTICLFPDMVLNLYGKAFSGHKSTLIICCFASYTFILYSLRADWSLATGDIFKLLESNILAGLCWIACAYYIQGSVGLSYGLLISYLIAILPLIRKNK